MTVYNSSEDGEGISVSGVTIYPAYAYVSLRKRNGTFTKRHRVYENDYADISSVAVGDVNGDGRPDLAVAASKLSILRNRGDGTFTLRRDYSTGPKPPRAVAIGDLNRDGKPDLVTANGTAVDVLIRR